MTRTGESDASNKYNVGTVLYKDFKGIQYRGTMTSYDAKEKLYKVIYEEDDGKELYKGEIDELLSSRKTLKAVPPVWLPPLPTMRSKPLIAPIRPIKTAGLHTRVEPAGVPTVSARPAETAAAGVPTESARIRPIAQLLPTAKTAGLHSCVEPAGVPTECEMSKTASDRRNEKRLQERNI